MYQLKNYYRSKKIQRLAKVKGLDSFVLDAMMFNKEFSHKNTWLMGGCVMSSFQILRWDVTLFSVCWSTMILVNKKSIIPTIEVYSNFEKINILIIIFPLKKTNLSWISLHFFWIVMKIYLCSYLYNILY